MHYGEIKDLSRRTASNKILRNKAINIAKNLKYGGYQRGITSMVYKCFDKKSLGSGFENENISSKELPEEYHKPIIRKFKKRNVYLSFIDNIRGADLADIELTSKFNQGIRFLLCFIDVFSKYPWVIPLKVRKELQLLMLFKRKLNDLIANQRKYGYIKTVNFTIGQ